MLNETPNNLGIEKGLIVAPDGGWEQQTHYVVEAAYSAVNTIKHYVFYSGFINNGKPSSYSCTFSKGSVDYSDIYYLKALHKINMGELLCE